jgi:glycogen phosphorylase
MATRRASTVEAKRPTAPQPEHPAPKALLEQYECGPIAFSGVPGALYERHVVFDHVVRLDQSDARQRFEAVAQAIRDVLSRRWLKTDATNVRANPKQVYYLGSIPSIKAP